MPNQKPKALAAKRSRGSGSAATAAEEAKKRRQGRLDAKNPSSWDANSVVALAE